MSGEYWPQPAHCSCGCAPVRPIVLDYTPPVIRTDNGRRFIAEAERVWGSTSGLAEWVALIEDEAREGEPKL